jgi:cellulose synthase/poly-beta-1,6-N-acetylglucosamine synthase-like glycosyltransferase
MSFIEILFWSSGLFIFYAYLGYPLVLWLVTLFRKESAIVAQEPHPLKATLLISVYNEEKVIEERILNALNMDYPSELLEIVVVSDGSDDRTHEIVSRYADRGVRLRSYEGRIGKTACLNKAVPLTEGEVVIFSDANSKYDRAAVKVLVKNFIDGRIGLVTGVTKYVSKEGDGLSDSIGLYWRVEEWTKMLESKIGSCIGADGAIFAVRKRLYRPLENYDINDFVIPMNVIEQGYRVKLDSDAFCAEETGRAGDEFGRQVRITNRTIRAIVNHLHLLNPFRYGWLSFELFSHKISRLFVPFLMIVFFATNLILAAHGTLYILLLIAQLLFYLLAGFGRVDLGMKILSRLASVSRTFGMANLAVLSGWIKYLTGEKSVVWAPSRK